MAYRVLVAAVMFAALAHAQDAELASIPGFVVKDGAYVPDEPYKDGAPKITGLQLPFPNMIGLSDNPMTKDKVELGKFLFFDPTLSGSNAMSCATCHHPDFGFADGRQLGMGVGGLGVGPDRERGATLERNVPTVWNSAHSAVQFWDGRAKTLEEQAKGPITARAEMGQDPDALVRELRAFPEYVALFEKTFGGSGAEAVTFDNVLKAIGAFERTIVSYNSPYDRYTQGDPSALSEPEKRGLKLYRSVKTRCFECHRFPHFADDTFRIVGVPPLEGHENDIGRAKVPGQGPKHAFKVPTLRNVALTAPYMHNGVFATLEEVIDFYANGGGHQFPTPVKGIDDKIGKFTLTPEEKADLVAFLHALTDTSNQPDPPERLPSNMPIVTVKTRAQPAPAPVALASLAAAPEDARLTRAPSPPSSPTASTAAGAPFAVSLPAVALSPNAATFTVRPGQSIQVAVDRAQPGDRIEVYPGVYAQDVMIDKAGISLIGINVNGERPILDGGGTMADAVNVAGDNFLIENLVIQNYVGNGCTVNKVKNVTFRNLTCINTGVYGIYPVECHGVLVEYCTVTGINDAGIYVGQSRDIIVRNNEAYKNVAGIEIENCVGALVENNTSHNNAAGMLVFVLPNNPSKVGEHCRVINNRIFDNNGPNFGKPGTIVASLPSGMGLIVMAADHTDVTKNTIAGNNTYGLSVISLTSSPGAAARQEESGHPIDIEPNSDHTRVYGNTLVNNGASIDAAFAAAIPGVPGGDILWDGSGEGNVFDQPDVKAMPPELPSGAGKSLASAKS
ncbi:MAG: parallel beta-helix domain-containing protein [Candidatus Hydrogenedentes bacterium]|nr:parallel beta-helix domain-containing protein [Candidatus Hydrogenedentota bacterium]